MTSISFLVKSGPKVPPLRHRQHGHEEIFAGIPHQAQVVREQSPWQQLTPLHLVQQVVEFKPERVEDVFFITDKMGNPVEGIGLELKIIAAVVIGGGSLKGGRGSVIGTLAGAAIMTVIASGCDLLEVRNPYQNVIVGVIIVAAVLLDQLRERRLASV